MTAGIAIFVKTPGLSPVKTRLAAGIGKKAAVDFHLASAKAVAAVVKDAARGTDMFPYFAVAEKAALAGSIWKALPTLHQGEGDLGRRLHRIYSELIARHGAALLLGSDAPQLENADLVAAAEWISDPGEPRFAFGPAGDGGFWTFGGNRSLPESLWTSVAYSRSDTGINLLAKTSRIGQVRMLRVLHDVDRAEDLPVLSQALASLAHAGKEQKRLRTMVDKVLLDRKEDAWFQDFRRAAG